MQAFLPASLLANPPALPSANPPTPSARAAVPNGNNAFSRQLEQSRQRVQENARPAPKPAANKAAAPPPAPAAKPPNRPPEPTRSEAQRAGAPRGPHQGDAPAAPDPDSSEASAEATSPSRADGSDAEATKPALTDLLGLVPPPADPAAVPTGATQAQPTADVPVPDGAAPGQPRPAALPGAALVDTAEGATATRGAAAAGTATQTPATALLAGQASEREPREVTGTAGTTATSWQHAQAAAALTESMGPAHEGKAGRLAEAHAITDGAERSLAPIGLAGPGTTLNTAKAGEVAQASLAAPVTSPEFRAALGAQVSILARAGVQQAELHLNPAELGPVSIQIVLDGQQAQVNFGADSALTRQIIEAGMPELAGALRDAGLTLTGGGVSQHAGGQRQDGSGDGPAGGSGSNAHSGTPGDGTTDAHAEQTRRSAVRVAQGGVDLYA